MITLASIIITGGGIGALLIWLVGVVVCGAIVYAIMRACDAPAWSYKILYVVALVVLLIVAIEFFFGVAPVRTL